VHKIISKAENIRLVIFDIDGVLTDGGLQFDAQGREYKTFNSLDGHGIRMLLECGIQAAVITGRQSRMVDRRMDDLGVKLVFQGYRDKRPAFVELLNQTGLEKSQIAYLGDDLPDLSVMTQVGLAIAVQNAHTFVKQQADWITEASGGAGAAREAIDFILNAQHLLEAKQASYLQ
jgi:3-deoxy-D-manno-octulosonate 8-phosphate phosphatase (KDO 8-P phosphatase)